MIDGQLDLLDELLELAEGQDPEQVRRDVEDQRPRSDKDERRTGRGD